MMFPGRFRSTGEIARILKRYVAREVFKHLPRPTELLLGPGPDPIEPALTHALCNE